MAFRTFDWLELELILSLQRCPFLYAIDELFSAADEKQIHLNQAICHKLCHLANSPVKSQDFIIG
jgi:hypothetical protein